MKGFSLPQFHTPSTHTHTIIFERTLTLIPVVILTEYDGGVFAKSGPLYNTLVPEAYFLC